MRPSLGASSPTIRRAMVDLPQPDSPTSARVSPWRTSSVTPSTARSSRLPSPSSTRSSQGRETSKSRVTASTLSNGARMQPAGGLARPDRHELGTRAQAALEALGAARMERASVRNRVEAWHRALDLREARAPRACRDARNGRHQARGIGVLRRMEHVADRTDLDDAARIHDRDAIGGLGDDAHVVRDQHHRRAAFARDALHEHDDLRLHRHVERRGRLVGDQQDRLRGERERDDHALAHAAGELVRIVVETRLRSRDADFGEQRQCPLSQVLSRKPEMRADRLLELRADRVERIERAERVLEHDADAPAADGAQGRVRQPVDAPPFEPDFARGEASRRLEQPHDGEAGERLAGARLADHAEHFAARHGKGHVIDCDQGAAPRAKLDSQVLRLENHLSFGFRASRSQSPSRLTDSTRVTSATPGNTVIHHSPENRKSLPTRMRVPSEGRVGGRPTPRKESVASVMMAVAIWMVAITSTGPMTFGSTCTSMMASGRLPITRAACTYSFSFSTRVEPRTVRAYCTQAERPMATISTGTAIASCAPAGSAMRATPSISSAIRIAGKDS